MTQATRFALAALVLTSAIVAPALAARQLKQTTGTINFPGCTFLQDSEIARNQDFSSAYSLLQSSGLSSNLSNLSSPATVFVPTNEAVAEYLMAANMTMAEAASSPGLAALLSYHLVSGAIMVSRALQCTLLLCPGAVLLMVAHMLSCSLELSSRICCCKLTPSVMTAMFCLWLHTCFLVP
jgi:uncharacterized surface protein with fasciclin (FAS1) repeats